MGHRGVVKMRSPRGRVFSILVDQFKGFGQLAFAMPELFQLPAFHHRATGRKPDFIQVGFNG